MDCVFCKIIAGEIPSNRVYQDDKVIAFHDINPKAKVHVLVVPRLHIPSADAVNADNISSVAAVFEAIPKIAATLCITDNYQVVNNCGEAAGQTVKHLHFHVMSDQ